jgi:ABC-type antimicrobial peptide transport system permease subunit
MEPEIVGVVKDFNFESLHEPIKPSFFPFYPIAPSFIVKIEKGREAETIQAIEKLYKSFATGYPFDFKFIDEDYQKLYESERRVSQLSQYFAITAIVISCLGLFGLASFAAEKRVKEIGIRKVLGSGVTGIVMLLSIDFTRIVIVAIGVALPVSYYMARTWLGNFAFRISLHWWYFAGAGLAALVIAWATIGLQTIKAARANPVDTLRTE